MMHWMNRLTRWLDHNRFLALGMLLALAASTYLTACTPRTTSLARPEEQVTARQFTGEVRQRELALTQRRHELDAAIADFNAQVDAFAQAVEAGQADLARQQQFRQQVLHTLGGFANQALQGSFSPVGAAGAVFSLVSMGAAAGLGADNLRKNRVIENLKKGGQSQPAGQNQS